MKDEAKRKVLDRRVLELEKQEKAAVMIREHSFFLYSLLPRILIKERDQN